MPRFTISCLLLANVALIAAVVPAASAPKKTTVGPPLSMANVNDATWRQGTQSTPFLIKLQVLLDRAHASPSQIDAKPGENTRKALAAFREMQSLPSGEKIDETLWRTLTRDDKEPVLASYIISAKDVAGPFIEKVPSDYREKANLKRLAYISAEELLAEKFHMSEALLRQLNPGAAFDQAGTEIVVASVQREDLPRKIARIEVNAAEQRVRAYDKDDRVVAIYPATVGSGERPSPEGEFKVTALAENPTYNYDPSLKLRGVDVQEKLELPPGPNNPVGLVWIALSAKGYGMHVRPNLRL
jgi:lipoprotein-anchoring transpeptidase ErfK/SrfK